MAVKGSKRSVEADTMAERATDELAMLGNVTSRKMFGGYGVYADGVMFAIVDPGGGLFFRADESTALSTLTRGCRSTGHALLGVPANALSDADTLMALAREALGIAVAGRSKRR